MIEGIMTNKRITHKEIVWAKGRKKSEEPKYTWWSGGDGIKTSISTNYDYIMAPGAETTAVAGNALAEQDENSMNLSIVVGFGF